MRRRSSICWRRTRWVRLLSVMSRAVSDAPMISPVGPLIGDTLSETSTLRPSLRKRTVSLFSIVSPQPIRRRMSRTSPFRSGGTISSIFLPTASAALYPNKRSAAGFHPVIVPSRDLVMMASIEASTAAENSRSRAA